MDDLVSQADHDAPRGRLDALAPREREVALLTAAGLSSSDVAERLSVKPGTIRATPSRIYGKLGVSNRRELAELVQSEAIGTEAPKTNASVEVDEDTALVQAARMLLPFSSLLLLMSLAWLGSGGFLPQVSPLSMSLGLLAGFVAVNRTLATGRPLATRIADDEASLPLGALVAPPVAQGVLCLALTVSGAPSPVTQLLGIALFASASVQTILCLPDTSRTTARPEAIAPALLFLSVVLMRLLSAGRVVILACLISQVAAVILLRARGERRWTLRLSSGLLPMARDSLLAKPRLLATGPDWFALCLAFYATGQRYAEVQQQLPLAPLPFLLLGAYGLLGLRSRLRFDPASQVALALCGAAALATFALPSPQLILLGLEGLVFAWHLERTNLGESLDVHGLQRLVPSALMGLVLGDVTHGCLQGCDLINAGAAAKASVLLSGAGFLLVFAIVGVGVAGGLAFARSCLLARARADMDSEKTAAPHRLERFQSYLRFRGLSDAQVLVAMKSLEGKTSREIASEMNYAPATVKAMRTSLYRKLSIRGLPGLISLYQEICAL